MILTFALTLLLLIMAVKLINTTDNYLMVLVSSLFSFTAACLYYLHSAPDIALAEIAIGCAFIPLIFTIAIMRQSTFTVVFFSQEGQQAYCDPMILLEFMAVAEEFCRQKQLKLKIVAHPISYQPNVKGIFRIGNTDLIANYFEENGTLTVWGNNKNKLLPDLADMLEGSDSILYENAETGLFME